MAWSLLDKEGNELKPLIFSNGKSQEDVVNEVLEAISKGHKIIFLKGICGSGKCLEKDTLVFCKPKGKDYGNYKISELVGKSGEVMALNESGNIVDSKFKNVRKTGKKKIYSLVTRTGREIMASSNHPFLTINETGLVWKKLEDLSPQNYICIPNNLKLKEGNDFDISTLKILGYLIAEGSLSDKAGSPRFHQSKLLNSEIREDYISEIKKIFPDGEIVEDKKSISVCFRNMDTKFGTTNKLRLLVRKFGLEGKKSFDKFVPSFIFGLRKKFIAEFLKSLFSGDGSIYLKKNKLRKENQAIIEYTSISSRLVRDVSLLLTRFGIQHTITKKNRGAKDYSMRINISSQKNVEKYIREIGFVGKKQKVALDLLKTLKKHKFTNIDKIPRVIRLYLKNKGYTYNELDRYINFDNIQRVNKNIGWKKIKKMKSIKTPQLFHQTSIDFLREHMREINRHIKDDALFFINNEDIFWDKIKSIGYVKTGETYDLEVEKYHNFIANGIIVHNSAMALNIAKKCGRASIVVPVKYLQEQYQTDYTDNFKVLKDDKTPLKISNLTGRNNFQCIYSENTRADDKFLPCSIDLKESNWDLIKAYIKNNPAVDIGDFNSVEDVRRISVAAACPHWSPVIGKDWFGDYGLKDAKEHTYKGLKDKDYIYFERKPGCKYYEQFMRYIDSDVLIFNNKKYEVENVLDRKPATDIEVIDECDEFLDSLSNEKNLNLDWMRRKIEEVISKVSDLSVKEALGELMALVDSLLGARWVNEMIDEKEILEIKDTKLVKMFNFLINNDFIVEYEELEQYYILAKSFEGLLDDTYVSFGRNPREDLIVRVVNINLKKKLGEILEKNKVFLMMSGTLHNPEVLRNIYGVDDFIVIDAETEHMGLVKKNLTGLEKSCRWRDFKDGRITREGYLMALEECVACAEKPFLVHVNSYGDLPSDAEKEEFGINIMSREKLQALQEKYRKGELLRMFKEGKIDALYSTKCNRGVDLPGDMCKSIIFTKYPFPAMQDIFWKILQRKDQNAFMEFYFDKAKREFIQRIYRGLRKQDDIVNLLSPDSKVMNSGV